MIQCAILYSFTLHLSFANIILNIYRFIQINTTMVYIICYWCSHVGSWKKDYELIMLMVVFKLCLICKMCIQAIAITYWYRIYAVVEYVFWLINN